MTQVMNQHQRMHHEAARQFSMGDVVEAPHPTLTRAETHATKRPVKILTAESTTNRTASPSITVIVMTSDERSQHEADRRFALGNVMNAAPLPTLPRAATVQPKNMNDLLNTRTTLTANDAYTNAAAAATLAVSDTSTVADDDHDYFKGINTKIEGIT